MKAVSSAGRRTEADRLHLFHCSGCQDDAHKRSAPITQHYCLPSHDPLDQGICFQPKCENYMNHKDGNNV